MNQSEKITPSLKWRNEYEKGRVLCQHGLMDEAIGAFKNAIRLNPAAAEIHHDLGVVFHQTGRYESALDCFQRATALDKQLAQAWFNGGNTFCALQRFDDAIDWFLQVLRIAPGSSDAHYNLANTYKIKEKGPEALLHYQAALRINPSLFEAHNNMGTIFLKSGRLEKAEACFRKALVHNPADPKAAYNLSLSLERLGRTGEAIEFATKAIELQPEYGEALSLMVSLLQQACDWKALKKAVNRLEQMTCVQLRQGNRPSEMPFLSFTRSADPRRNLQVSGAWSQWLEQHTKRHQRQFSFADRKTQTSNYLTIGYLSEQFRNAATAHLMAGLFAKHDRGKYKINAYSWGRDDGSVYRRKIERDVDQFVDIRNMSANDAAERIYSDKVDILVDLMGWMHGHRMEILLKRPAPVQVNYLGYPGTTGASFMDYIIADRVVIPPEHQQYFSEKVVYLPHCYQVTDPDPNVDQTPMERTDCGLPENGVVFCSFSTDYKIEPRVFDMWMRILNRVPDSVLWLLVRSPEAQVNLRRAAAYMGVDSRRLIFAKALQKDKHLARLKLADLALDTLTVNGHTTASDALWAGVPLITCQGTHFASRVAASIIQSVGLPELVVDCMEEYERLAARLANSPEQLQALKRKLAGHKSTHPLFDVQRFARHLEYAYHNMWQRFAKNLPTESFEVPFIE